MTMNKLFPFAQGASANVPTDSNYESEVGTGGGLVNGVSSGLASSALFNKLARQSTSAAAGLAQFLVDVLSVIVTDSDGNAVWSSRISDAVKIVSSQMGFDQSFATNTGYPVGCLVTYQGQLFINEVAANAHTPSQNNSGWTNITGAFATVDWVKSIAPNNFSSVITGTTLTVPAQASHIELFVQGAGGGGCGCAGTSFTSGIVSGGGGGAGGCYYGVIPVTAGDVLTLEVGSGGENGTGTTSGKQGGTTSVTSTAQGTLVSIPGGGGATINTDYSSSAGGSGSKGTYINDGVIFNQVGSDGSDGQLGTFVFAGNGGTSFFGDGGRAGSPAGRSGSDNGGGGGGGAYDPSMTGKSMSGGWGSSGLILWKWFTAV